MATQDDTASESSTGPALADADATTPASPRPLMGSTSQARSDAARRFLAALESLRGQERRTVVLEGLACLVLVLLIGAAAAAGYLDAARFEEQLIPTLRWGLACLAAVLLLGFVVWRASRVAELHMFSRQADKELSRQDALIRSAFEATTAHSASDATRDSDALVTRLLATATERLTTLKPDMGRTQARRRRAGGLVVVAVVATVIGYWLGSPGMRYAAQLLAASSPGKSVAVPYQVAVAPGNSAIIEGDPVNVSATLTGFDTDDVVLKLRQSGEAWRSASMRRADNGLTFGALIADVTERTEYQVSADGVTSEIFTLDVIPIPKISRIDVEYEYPAYTGLPRAQSENVNSLSGVKGTIAHLRLHVDGVTERGELVIDGEGASELQGKSGEVWEATLKLAEDGQFRIDLQAADGRVIAATPDMPIYAMPDNPVRVRVVSPGRDAKVTSVEEVEIVTEAVDDTALHSVELVVSVNGKDEQVISMLGSEATNHIQPSHLMMLEERSLEPGDLIAYYVRATDHSKRSERMRQSDIFFMEVRPFEKRYRRSNAGGGGRGSGGGGQGDLLAAQQRSLVIGLFTLNRDLDRMDKLTTKERMDILQSGQGRIRVRTEAIVRRTRLRSGMRASRPMEQMAEELPKAVAAMTEVEAQLKVAKPEEALPKAREALAHLQRADAAFREVRVAARQNQGGNGRGSAAEDLGNLFKLEMDKFKSQYAHVQHGKRGNSQRPIDEVLEKLKRLAERHTRNARRMQPSGAQREALAQAVKELIRQLERLSAKHRSPEIAEAKRALERAVRAMPTDSQQSSQQVANSSQGGQQSQHGRQQRGQDPVQEQQQASAGNQALSGPLQGKEQSREDRVREALRQAESALRGEQARQLVNNLNEREAEINQLRGDQKRIQSLMRAQQQAIAEGKDKSQLQERSEEALQLKERMRKMESRLRTELERLARSNNARGTPAIADVRSGARALRDGRTEMRLAWTERALRRDARAFRSDMEKAISQSLDDVGKAIANARAKAQPQDAKEAALRERLRNLAFRLAELERQGRAAAGTANKQNGRSTERLAGASQANDKSAQSRKNNAQSKNNNTNAGNQHGQPGQRGQPQVNAGQSGAGGESRRPGVAQAGSSRGGRWNDQGGASRQGGANNIYFVTGIGSTRQEARRVGRVLADYGHNAQDIAALMNALDGIEGADAQVGVEKLRIARDAVQKLWDAAGDEAEQADKGAEWAAGTPRMSAEGRLPVAARGLAERYSRSLSEGQ